MNRAEMISELLEALGRNKDGLHPMQDIAHLSRNIENQKHDLTFLLRKVMKDKTNAKRTYLFLKNIALALEGNIYAFIFSDLEKAQDREANKKELQEGFDSATSSLMNLLEEIDNIDK